MADMVNTTGLDEDTERILREKSRDIAKQLTYRDLEVRSLKKQAPVSS